MFITYFIGLGDRHPYNILFNLNSCEIINIDYDLPFQPYMEEYNLLIYEIDDKWEQFKDWLSNSSSKVDSKIDKAQMIPICGSDRIHSHLNKSYNNHTLTEPLRLTSNKA